MRAHLSNAAFGVLDYAAYPIGMLLVAPVVLRNLGVEQYGVWAVATAAVNTGSVIASGFGDSNTQHIVMERANGDFGALRRVVRSTMGIHVVLGAAMAIILWVAAPFLAARIGAVSHGVQMSCLWCLRIAGSMTFVRAIESVCVSTQRAFERYGAAVRISVVARLFSLAAAAALTSIRHSVVTILAVTAVLTTLGLGLQLLRLRELLGAGSLSPRFDALATKELFRFGVFSWLLATSGVLFNQVDRLIGGVYCGAATVASYALCAQLAQPIYGVAASGLHFLFPYLSRHRATGSAAMLKKAFLLGFAANAVLVLGSTFALLLMGDRILLAWGGFAIAHNAEPVLPIVVWSSALMGLNVTGSYAMLALGRVQTITWINLAAGVAMLLLIVWSLPRYGIIGIAGARLIYGVITLSIYVPLALHLRPGREASFGIATRVRAEEQA